MERESPRIPDDLLTYEAHADMAEEDLPFRVLADGGEVVPRNFPDFGSLPYAAVLDAQMIIRRHEPAANSHTIDRWVRDVLRGD